MKIPTVKRGRVWAKRSFQIWVFFVVMVVALICSTVLGVQPVRASACTTDQCNSASNFAINVCTSHGPYPWVLYFECPFNSGSEPDDFFFECTGDNYSQTADCGTGAPS